MNKYLVEIQKCGEELPSRTIIEAKNDDEAIKKIYMEEYCGCYDEDDYEDEEGEELDVDTAMDEMLSNEDVLMFIFNITKCDYVYEYEM